ncbi:hypothetical protein GLOIN_2v1494815, partial [Rhizophagus irregularis DAOM 181602=DAOM 197198]
ITYLLTIPNSCFLLNLKQNIFLFIYLSNEQYKNYVHYVRFYQSKNEIKIISFKN